MDAKFAHVWLRCSTGRKGLAAESSRRCSGPAGHFITVTLITNKLKIFQLLTKILGLLVLIEDWPGSHIACQAGPAHATALLGQSHPAPRSSGRAPAGPPPSTPQILPRNQLACGLLTSSAAPEAATLSIFSRTTRASSPEPTATIGHHASWIHFPCVKADLQAFPQFRLPRFRLFRSYHSDAQIATCTFSPPRTTGKINSHGTIRRLPTGCPVSVRLLANKFRSTGQDLSRPAVQTSGAT